MDAAPDGYAVVHQFVEKDLIKKVSEKKQRKKNSKGKKIGGFIIGKGKGTFGKVKHWTHIVTGDKVAIIKTPKL